MADPSFSHIACCIDDSGAAARALAHADALRALSGGKLSVLHVLPSPAFLTSLAASLGGAPVHDSEHGARRRPRCGSTSRCTGARAPRPCCSRGTRPRPPWSGPTSPGAT